MAFDGVEWASAPLIPPRMYAPGTIENAKVPSFALMAAYTAARHHGQLAVCCHVAQDHQNLGLQTSYDSENQTSFVSFGAGYHFLPLSATHLVAVAAFNYRFQTYSQAQLRLVTHVPGGGTDTGVTVSVDPPQNAIGTMVTRFAPSWLSRDALQYGEGDGGGGPFSSDFPGNAVARCEVALSNVAPGQIVLSKVQGFCTDLANLAVRLAPQVTLIFWECRG